MPISKLVRYFTNNYVMVIPAVSIAAALLVLGYIAFEHTTPGRVLFYQRLSHEFAQGSVEQRRFSTIAKAISQGKKHYTFSAGHMPTLTSK